MGALARRYRCWLVGAAVALLGLFVLLVGMDERVGWSSAPGMTAYEAYWKVLAGCSMDRSAVRAALGTPNLVSTDPDSRPQGPPEAEPTIYLGSKPGRHAELWEYWFRERDAKGLSVFRSVALYFGADGRVIAIKRKEYRPRTWVAWLDRMRVALRL